MVKRIVPCQCGGYWFPHRIGSGACVHNKDIAGIVRCLQARHDLSDEEALDLLAQLAFDMPGILTNTCPF